MYALAWMFAQLMNSSRRSATELSPKHLQPFGDSPRSVEVSRHRSSLSSHGCRLNTDRVWSDCMRVGQRHEACSARETVRNLESDVCSLLLKQHASRVHSLGISYVYFKTYLLLTHLFLRLAHVYHLLNRCVRCSGSLSLAKLDTTKLSRSIVCWTRKALL